MDLSRIRRILLDEASPASLIEAALDSYSRTCAEVTGITPDAGFDAWAQDRFLDHGIAINPRAAAHCVTDYRRTLVFQRAVHAALLRLLAGQEDAPVHVLYAGCGPYATLLLPILDGMPADRLRIRLLDVHQSALDGVHRLIEHFGLQAYAIDCVLADACSHRCEHAPQLIIAETMQKALEQEPQFAVTANLGPQLAEGGIFVPERIDVDLCLILGDRYQRLGRVLSLSASVDRVPEPVAIRIPNDIDAASTRAALVTSIKAFEEHRLGLGDAHITLARPCPELTPLTARAEFRVAFRPGRYPVFEIGAADSR